mgnify:CR=1 FL=1
MSVPLMHSLRANAGTPTATISRPSREAAAVISSKKLAGPAASVSATDCLALPFALGMTGAAGIAHSRDCRLPNGMVQSKPTLAPMRWPPSDGSSGTTRKPLP